MGGKGAAQVEVELASFGDLPPTEGEGPAATQWHYGLSGETSAKLHRPGRHSMAWMQHPKCRSSPGPRIHFLTTHVQGDSAKPPLIPTAQGMRHWPWWLLSLWPSPHCNGLVFIALPKLVDLQCWTLKPMQAPQLCWLLYKPLHLGTAGSKVLARPPPPKKIWAQRSFQKKKLGGLEDPGEHMQMSAAFVLAVIH